MGNRMKRLILAVLAGAVGAFPVPLAGAVADALRLEREGRMMEARIELARSVERASDDAEARIAWAEFLDRHGGAGVVEAYRQAIEKLPRSEAGKRREMLRRLVPAALLAGDADAAREALNRLRGEDPSIWPDAARALQAPASFESTAGNHVVVPGVLNSFLRMAALSTDLRLEELLPALAQNIVTGGYRATGGPAGMEPTEYLKLIMQYLSQARELEQFAGADNTIDVPACESMETAQLLKILGFRLRGECGAGAVLETVNPSRAFLSIDSAFPLADLEAAYQRDEAFHLDYRASELPILFDRDYWLAGAKKAEGDFLDIFLGDPGLARLYVAMSRLHRPTAEALKAVSPVDRLKDYANVLDFFGAAFEVESGRAVAPGGDRAKAAWEKLAGQSTADGGRFFQRLIELDDGWLAAFYDALARTGGPARDYLTEPQRIERFYAAVRGKITSPGPARPIFRANAELLLLATRLHFNSDGSPYIPGGVEPWKNLFVKHPHGKYDGRLTRSANTWRSADDVIEAMFALCRKAIENEPLKIFLAVSNIDRRRSVPLAPATVERLILAFPLHGEQFALYNDSPNLSDAAITAHLDAMPRLDKINSYVRRADATGAFQALIGLWQVLRRNGAIPEAQADESLRAILAPFAQIRNQQAVFEAGRNGILALLRAAGHEATEAPQEVLIELLAGDFGPGEDVVHRELVERMNRLLNLQRLIPLKTLFDLADHLERVSRGEAFNVAMANRLAANISEIRLPYATLSSAESNTLTQGHWVERHIRDQRTLNLRRAVDRARENPAQLLEIRGDLAPMLRDSLVGLLYAFYSPPGAEIIQANPLFIRSHDFLGPEARRGWSRARIQGFGWPNSGGGRIVGSLMTLPYGLASAEQNFMVPTERQALIWQDLAPQMLLGATVPRWWKIDPAELQFVGLHLRLGKLLLARAALDPAVLGEVMGHLRRRVEPSRLWKIGNAFRNGAVRDGVDVVTPAELFALAKRARESSRGLAAAAAGPHLEAIERLAARDPSKFNYDRAARLFGMPHPRLARSYSLELLNLPLFPTMMGYSSRILAESWESNNLFWAALADELHIAPAQLNLLIPEWTQRSLERIFATHLDDWPALWRSLRLIADEVRKQQRPRLEQEVQTALASN